MAESMLYRDCSGRAGALYLQGFPGKAHLKWILWFPLEQWAMVFPDQELSIKQNITDRITP